MSNLSWGKNVTVDGNITYHFKASHQGAKFDDWVESHPCPQTPAAPDIIAVPVSPTSTDSQFIIEVKNFQVLSGNLSDKNTIKLPDNFIKKITTCFMCITNTHDSLRLNESDLNYFNTTNRTTLFILHVILPDNFNTPSVKASFPRNYPINALQSIRIKIPKEICTNPRNQVHLVQNNGVHPFPWSVSGISTT